MEFTAINDRKVFVRTFFSIFLLVVCLEVVFGLFSYHMITKGVKEQLQARCLGISTSVAAFLESNPDAYKEFSKSLDTNSDYYKRVDSVLKKIFYSWENHIIYLGSSIFVPETHRMILFGMVKDTANPLYGPPGALIELSEEGIHAYRAQKVYVSQHPIESQYGSYISAFVPIRDRDNQVIGMVTARISGEQYTEAVSGIISAILSVLTIITAIFGIATLFYFGFFEKLFYLDQLTGLYNRAFFLNKLKKHHSGIKRQRAQSFVFMLDLDHFKNVNDTYGHPFGDIVLKNVAIAVKSALRESDCVARYGGEEFVGLVTNLSLDNATAIMERVLSTVAAARIYSQEHGISISVTLSIGYAALDEKEPPSATLKKADLALYHAKKTRNTISFFNEHMKTAEETVKI